MSKKILLSILLVIIVLTFVLADDVVLDEEPIIITKNITKPINNTINTNITSITTKTLYRKTVTSPPIITVNITLNGLLINGKDLPLLINYKNQSFYLNETAKTTRDEINFTTNIIQEGDKVRYNHTFSSTLASSDIPQVSYIVPKDCTYNSIYSYTDCGTFIINFTETVAQKIDITFDEVTDKLTFEKTIDSDLKYIDPIIQATGSPTIPDVSSNNVIVRNSTGSLFVIYSKPTLDVYLAISDDNGITWRDSTDTNLNLGSGFSTLTQGTLIINSSDDLHVFSSSYQDAGINYVTSLDSGVTFSSVTKIVQYGGTGDFIRKLSSIITENDHIVLAAQDSQSSSLEYIRLINTTNSGTVWTSTNAININENDNSNVELIYNYGRYHLIYDYENGPINLKYSNSTQPTSFSSSSSFGGYLNGINVRASNMINDDIRFVAYSTSTIYYFNTTNNGTSWSNINLTFINNLNLGIVTADNNDIYILYSNGTNILHTNSTDGGLTWAVPSSIVYNASTISDLHIRGSRYPSFNNIDGRLDFVYHVNGTANDIYFGNISIPFANQPPLAPTLNHPAHLSAQNFNNSILFNFTTTDVDNDGIIYSLFFSTDVSASSYITSFTNISGASQVYNYTNITGGFADGIYYWKVLAEDNSTHNPVNVSSSIYQFQIATQSPSINLQYPSDAQWFNTPLNIWFNFTATDNDGINECQLNSNFSGDNVIFNRTISGVTSGVQKAVQFNFTEGGLYTWNVNCSDTIPNYGYSLNKTMGVDLTAPNVTINGVSTSAGSQNIQMSVNSSDSLSGLSNCFYSIFNSTGDIDGLNSNLSTSCNSVGASATVSGYSTFTLVFNANDSAGNINYTSFPFTTTASSGGTQQTGGGGGGDTIITVISGNLSWEMYTDKKSDKYELIMTSISNTRTKKILFKNTAQDEINLTIECEDINGNLCQFVTLSKTALILPPTTGIESEIEFTLDIDPKGDQKVEYQNYVFNIKATDQNQASGRAAVNVIYKRFNIISDTIQKLFVEKTSIGKLNVFNFIIVFFFGIVFAFISYAFTNKKNYGGFLSLSVGFVIGMIVLIIL